MQNSYSSQDFANGIPAKRSIFYNLPSNYLFKNNYLRRQQKLQHYENAEMKMFFHWIIKALLLKKTALTLETDATQVELYYL